MFKIKLRVYIDAKPIGLIRVVNREVLVTTTLTRATTFEDNPQGHAEIGFAITQLPKPDVEGAKLRTPLVSFQAIRC